MLGQQNPVALRPYDGSLLSPLICKDQTPLQWGPDFFYITRQYAMHGALAASRFNGITGTKLR